MLLIGPALGLLLSAFTGFFAAVMFNGVAQMGHAPFDAGSAMAILMFWCFLGIAVGFLWGVSEV